MKLNDFYEIWCHRTKPYAIQQKNGDYLKIDSTLTKEALKEHLKGKTTLGTYTTSADNTCRCICVDIDADTIKDKGKDKFKKSVEKAEKILSKFNMPYLKEETGGRGYHFWIIFKSPVPVEKAYKIGLKLRRYLRKKQLKVEVFPKQGELNSNLPYGNLVKVPLGIHQKYKNKSHFDTPVKKIQIEYFNPKEADIPKVKIEKPKVSVKSRMPCTENMMAGCAVGKPGRDETALRLAVRFYKAGIPQPDAWELLKQFNNNCKPPLSEGVLERKLDQGFKGKYGLGCNSSVMEAYCDPSCFLYDRYKEVTYEEEELVPDKGFLKYYLRYNDGNDAPRIFHLLTALQLISIVATNKIWANPFGAGKLYPNLYVLFAAPSGHRKTTAMNIGKDLIEEYDDSLLFPDSIASYEAYLTCFEEQPQSSFFLSEFSRFMRRLVRENMGGVKDILTELYDCPTAHKVFSKGEGAHRIENACINILAACTPVYLESSTKPEDWQEGFMSRFIVANASRTKLKGVSERTKQEEKMKKKMINWFSKLEDFQGRLDFSEIEDDLNKAIKKYSHSKNEMLTGFYNRAADYLMKFSMLYHLSYHAKDQDKKVSKESLDYAKKLFGYIEKTYTDMLDDLSLTKESKDINRIYRLIRDSKEYGMAHSKLMQKSGFLKYKFKNIIDTLESSKKIGEIKGNYNSRRYYERSIWKKMKEEEKDDT